MKSKSRQNLLSMSKAAHCIHNYERFRANPGQVDFTPVQSYQFSIESIENYIQFVKGLAGLKGIEVTGLRVVNAVYPSDADDRGQQTVLFIPTYKNRNGEDEAFDPLYVRNGVPVDLNELLRLARDTEGEESKVGRKMMMSMESSSEESSFMNFGKMGKPPVID